MKQDNLPIVYGSNLPVPYKKPGVWRRLKYFFDNRIRTVRKIDWFELVEPEYVRYKIIPDTSVRNWRTEDLLKTVSDQFQLPIDRIVRQGLRIKGYRIQERTSYEISFSEGRVNFYINVPKNIAPLFSKRIYSIWDKATIEEVPFEKPYSPKNTDIYELVYNRHDMYSLHVDHKDNSPLGSVLEAGELINEGERGKLFIYFDPIYQLSWHSKLEEAWGKLREGKSPRKWNTSFRNIAMIVGINVSQLLGELVTAVGDVISEDNSKNKYKKAVVDPEAMSYSVNNLSEHTRGKRNKAGVKTYVWSIAESKNEISRDLIAKTIGNSTVELNGDNELKPRKVTSKRKKKSILNTVNTNKVPDVKINYNVMSTSEASKLTQLPGRELQERFPNIERVEQLQTQLNPALNGDGIYIGDTVYKGNNQKVFYPVAKDLEDKGRIDELCLPHIGIGGMGQGKTEGLLANWVFESVRNGYGAMAIDPAKREIGDELERVLKKDEIIRLDLSQMAFSLDWCEALYSKKARSRLAGTIISFFGVQEDTTGQTERYLRAAVMAMETGKVSEIIRIFEDEKMLDKAINSFTDPEDLNKITLQQFKGYQAGMRRQILAPIYNRLNYILSDPHLAECIKSNVSLDMVELLTQKKAIVIDVPDDDLDPVAQDIIINLISSKIDIAMRLRKKLKGPEAEFPFFVLMDEPHKYLRSAKLWTSATVESRKWRIGYFWTFHYWEQIPTGLQKAIKNALCHYHLYPSSKETFAKMKEEIYPFTLEDAGKLKRWHAINILRVDGEYATPFIAKMANPPSKRRKKKKEMV